ncbi:MAG: hypothetical protein ACRETG_12895, partial [Steroidobacteraceae bacterium]
GLDGDTAEQLQRARLQRYNAAKELVASDQALVYWYAGWARFENSACRTTAGDATSQQRMQPGSTPAGEAATVVPAASLRAGDARGADPDAVRPADAVRTTRALYLWHSAAWLANAASGPGAREFAEMHSAGVGRLLISLDAAQMRRALAQPLPLVRAVRSTQEHGFRVELLLGDPEWILPAQRGTLLAIIRGLRSVPFDGLHLDLEPEQLDDDAERRTALLGSLAQTLAAASAASPWPVALSIHPRDLDAQLGNASFAEVLRKLRVSPTLMVYVANPERAVAIARPLLGRYPQLSFSVALSLEKSLGPEESLWSYPEEERRRRIARVESQLTAANFTGLTLELEDAWSGAASLAGLAAAGE